MPKMKLLLRLAATVLTISLLARIAYASEFGKKVCKESLLICARAAFPESFFRHAKWSAKADASGKDLKKLAEPMHNKEFLEKFPPIPSERALDIYYMIAVTQKILPDHEIKSLPVGGTMLGLLRNGGQLPHDDDADFVVSDSDLVKIKSLEKEFNRYQLSMRSAFGISAQIYPTGGKNTLELSLAMIWNVLSDQLSLIKLKKEDMTTRGFIDLMSVKYHAEDEVYRYADLLAEDLWWQQTFPRELIDSQYLDYPYGPLILKAPSRHLLEKSILEVYPDSLNYAMRTVDHRQTSSPDYVLVPLTPEQKKPFPLTEKDLKALQARFAKVGLKLANGRLIEAE